MTSRLSATMIGCGGDAAGTARQEASRRVYQSEAAKVATALESNHYSRRLKNMQVYYPETITKLSHKPQYAESLSNSGNQRGSSSRATEVVEIKKMRESDFLHQRSEQAHREHDLNLRKRLYNKEVGRKAVVNKIMTGEAPPGKEILFPQVATHQQILALTGSLKMPDPNKQPPDVPRGRKWLGDGVGWDSTP